MLMLYISYNTNEHAIAITYQPRIEKRRTLVIVGADDAEDEDEDEQPIRNHKHTTHRTDPTKVTWIERPHPT